MKCWSSEDFGQEKNNEDKKERSSTFGWPSVKGSAIEDLWLGKEVVKNQNLADLLLKVNQSK